MKVERGGAYREDGYVNLLTNYGTRRDSSTAYSYQAAPIVDDQTLTEYYISNGLFARIIDIPAERAATGGYDLGLNDEDLENIVTDALDDLDWEALATEAIKWTRLFGGAIGVMLIDDGGTLEQPLNYRRIRGIDEIVMFERTCVEPDYTRLYGFGGDGCDIKRKMRDPEYFRVTSQMGSFVVHESRCLIFRSNKLPELTPLQQYQYWGVPEYIRIRNELRETMVSHGYSVRMLERCIQAVHKMGDLALKMASDEGEAEVLKRMELVDLARGLFNTIVIDKDGEDYGFQTYTMAGVKDILDGSCNMLSAVSQIPQTLLFGRSPAGENATGESDMENFYGFLGGLQKVSLKPAASRLIDVIFLAAKNTGKIDSVPKFKINFKPFWTLSDAEEADLDKARADAAFVRAQAAALYVTNQVLMPEEVREGLKSSNDFNVENLVDDDESDWDIPDTPDTPPNLTVQATETPEQEKTPPNPSGDMGRSDGEEVHGVGVLVLDGDKVLCAKRHDGPWWGGPGGHIEKGESPEVAAARETQEEFNIKVKELRPLGRVPYTEEYGSPYIFLCTKFEGRPKADGEEMRNQQWKSPEELILDPETVFPPFYDSLKLLFPKLFTEDWEESEHDRDKSGKFSEMGSSSDADAKENAEKSKKELKNSENSGNMYAEEQVTSYIKSPKRLGETTHREKYDDFITHGVDVKPLSHGSQKGREYLDGGGYKVGIKEDGATLYCHPVEGSHHDGEYYKLSSGKGGTKRYDMDGNPKE